MIIFISILLVPVANVFAPIDLTDIRVKVVIWFEYPKNINPLKNEFNRDLAPLIDSRIQTFGGDFDNFTYEIEPVDTAITQWGTNATSGNKQYEAYPKVVFFGTNSTMSQVTFDSNFNTLVLQVEQDIIDFLLANGGADVSTHLHFSWGSVDLDKGF